MVSPSFSDHSRFKEHAWKTANPVHIPLLKPLPFDYELNKDRPPPKRDHFYKHSSTFTGFLVKISCWASLQNVKFPQHSVGRPEVWQGAGKILFFSDLQSLEPVLEGETSFW